MADRSKIEWTDASWNPIRARNRATGKMGWHCEHKSPGCANCYAEGFNVRLGTGLPFKPGHRADVSIVLDAKILLQPLRWRQPRMVFVGSMTDLFAEFVPDALIDQVFAVMALRPWLTFQVLTKRSTRMRAYLSDPCVVRRVYELACDIAIDTGLTDVVLIAAGYPADAPPPQPRVYIDQWPLPNVWAGVSAEDQERADERVPDLRATPAAVRFVSAEPLLGPLDLRDHMWPVHPWWPTGYRTWRDAEAAGATVEWRRQGFVSASARFIDWVIVGGESGRDARFMHPDWVTSIHEQCTRAEVSFFFKQWGEYAADKVGPEDARSLQHPVGHVIYRRVGKKAAGRKLFGIEHNGMPGMVEQ